MSDDREREARIQAAKERYGDCRIYPPVIQCWIEDRLTLARQRASHSGWVPILEQLSHMADIIMEADARGAARALSVTSNPEYTVEELQNRYRHMDAYYNATIKEATALLRQCRDCLDLSCAQGVDAKRAVDLYLGLNEDD